MRLVNYSLREIARRPGRTTLTLSGIAIGVAAIVAISITIRTTRGAYREMFESVTGRAALEVVAEGLGGFDPADVAPLGKLPGIRAVVPVIQTYSALLAPKGVVPVMVLAIDPAQDRSARDFDFRRGRQLAADDELVLETGFAKTHSIELGRPLRMMAPGGTTEFKVVGLLEPTGPAAIAGGSIAFMRLAKAQQLFQLASQINSAQLVLDEGVVPGEIEPQIAARLPSGLAVQPPAMRGRLSQDSLLSTEHGLSAMSAVSLVAGAFVILNTFLMSLGERQRQLAILRALGTTRSQVTRLLVAEAVLLGSVGTIAGVGLGLVLAVALTRGMEGILQTTLPNLRLTAEPFVLAGILGPGMSLAATYLPAWRAGRRSILAGLFDEPAHDERLRRRWPSYVGMAFVGADLVMIYGFLHNWFPAAVIAAMLPPAMVGFLVGSVLMVPLVIMPLGHLAAALLRPLLGVEGKLAFRQLDRRPQRTGLTVGVLFIAIVVAIGMGNSLINNIRDIGDWTERTITSDFFVRSVVPDTGILVAASLPESLADRMAGLAGVRSVDKLNFLQVRAEGERVLLLARSSSPGRPVSLDLAEGTPDEVLRGLRNGEVVLGTALARRLAKHQGDSITLETRAGPRPLRIAGTTTEYTVGGMAIYMDRDAAARLLKFKGVDVFMLSAQPGRAGESAKQIEALCREENLLMQSQADFRQMLDRMMAGVIGFLWLLMALVFVVASLGVVNTLTMNALEQTREFGVLRAIGMWRRQVRKMILAQAVAMALVAVLPGAVMGVVLAYLVNVSTYPIIGHPIEFHLQPGLVLGCAAAAVIISVLAAIFPARRAAALEVVRALQYE